MSTLFVNYVSMITRILIFSLTLFSLVSLQANTDLDNLRSNFKYEFKPGEFPKIKFALAKKWVESRSVDFDLLTFALFEHEMVRFSESAYMGDYSGNFSRAFLHARLTRVLQDINQPKEIKLAIDKALSEIHQGSETIYNKEHRTIFSALLLDKVQCYSGTILYEMARRSFGKSDYELQNPVLIFQDGHVLPGNVVNEDGTFVLYGIEMTTSGQSQIKFGNTENLQGVRVVEANTAIFLDVMANHISNIEEAVGAALLEAGEKYNIPVLSIEPTLEKKVFNPFGNQAQGTKEGQNHQYIGSSPFAFGDSSDVPSGDLAIEPMDSLNLDSNELLHMNVTEVEAYRSMLQSGQIITGIIGSPDAEVVNKADLILIKFEDSDEPVLLSSIETGLLNNEFDLFESRNIPGVVFNDWTTSENQDRMYPGGSTHVLFPPLLDEYLINLDEVFDGKAEFLSRATEQNGPLWFEGKYVVHRGYPELTFENTYRNEKFLATLLEEDINKGSINHLYPPYFYTAPMPDSLGRKYHRGDFDDNGFKPIRGMTKDSYLEQAVPYYRDHVVNWAVFHNIRYSEALRSLVGEERYQTIINSVPVTQRKIRIIWIKKRYFYPLL